MQSYIHVIICLCSRTGRQWLKVVPWGMRKVLNWVKARYGEILVYVTTAMSDRHGQINDTDRIDFIRDYANEVLKGL